MNEIIATAAQKANGRRKDRIVTKNDILRFEEMVNQYLDNREIKSIRVYSSHGFVANSYKWRAEISVLQATRNEETGELVISGFTVDAKRSYGSGALVTINGRAV